jgi:cytochrome c oxidase subunit 3
MWAFLATEVLFFGALIAAYLNYRIWFGADFIAAARMTKVWLGTANTAVLLTSSACMAMAVTTFEAGSKRAPVLWLIATALLGLAFVGIKATEWFLEYREQLVPALDFDLSRYGGVAEIFFVFYFCATGLHAVHLLIGISLVSWLAISIARGTVVPGDSTTRLIGLYWHFVDIVWIFLFPLIYLAGRAA